MKKFLLTLIACVLGLGIATHSSAIDFKIKGQWDMFFAGGDAKLLKSTSKNGVKTKQNLQDKFAASQRIRLQLDAIASENLSGTVFFQIGRQDWGRASQGGALGADGIQVKVRTAFIDWMVPETEIKTRMGLQHLRLPDAAGGPAVLSTRVAGITFSSPINENIGLTGFWIRPFNDNFNGETRGNDSSYRQYYLDNMDLFGLTIPVKFDGVSLTPWAMYGMRGKNAQWTNETTRARLATAGWPNLTLYPYMGLLDRPGSDYTSNSTGKAYGSMFWAGIPIKVTTLEPWNIEFDFNYGYVEAMGRYNVWKGPKTDANLRRASTERQGWLAKALVEYKLDWGIPGIFGWYASGDDDNIKNGSERMPSLAAYGNFTTFMGDSSLTLGDWHDMDMDYSGTWGIGAQLKNMTFFTDQVKNTFKVAYWGGTNAPANVKYMQNSYSWNDGIFKFAGPYLTTNDGLLEFNWITDYKMYENFLVQLELGYIANFIDNDTWKKAGDRNTSFSKQDAWKAQMVFFYSF